MKYTLQDFQNICQPFSTDLVVDLKLGPKDAYDIQSLFKLCANRVDVHSDWGILANRIYHNYLVEKTGHSFVDNVLKLADYFQDDVVDFCKNNKGRLDSILDESRSYDNQAISIAVLANNYLIKKPICDCGQDCENCQILETHSTPEKMYLRIATAMFMPDLDEIEKCYHNLSDKKISGATPTMFNAGLNSGQLASCVIFSVDDTIESIAKNAYDSMMVSADCAGIGTDLSRIRHSKIRNAGMSAGVPGLVKPLNEIVKYVTQGKKRRGSAAIYLAAWHIDIREHIMMRCQVGQNAKDDEKMELFPSVWLSDLFMERCDKDDDWSLFCPNLCKGLTEVWGDEFKELYCKYEKQGRHSAKIKARYLLDLIYESQTKTGLPYICYKDAFNRSNMQKNIGIIRSSNLCVSGDTFILTDKGQLQIKTLVDQKVNVWNGEKFTNTVVKQTGVDQKMVRVTFSNGSVLECTPYHKFYIQNSDNPVQAQELTIGSKLINCKFPILNKSFDGTTPFEKLLNAQLCGHNPNIVGDQLVLKTNNTITVTSIEQLDQVRDTFCFTEKERGMGIFNGVITGQCSEIALHTSNEEIASCNLASICLSNFVKNQNFDFDGLAKATRFAVRFLNRVIDRNNYSGFVKEIKYANLKNRPIGIGMQGLAATYAKMELLFDSKEARELNKKIIQYMYYYAVDESANLATAQEPYPEFPGSPYSQGKLHPDLWRTPDGKKAQFISELDWDGLRLKVRRGVRNSTLLALMPTASSSIIAGQSPCFEPFNFILGTKTILSGQYTVMCQQFVKDMQKLGVWNEELANQISFDGKFGSVQHLQVPDSIKEYPMKIARFKFIIGKYRTSFEIGVREAIIQSVARQPFVCQSQSVNWFGISNKKKWMGNVIGAWKRGAKTGCYYARSVAGAQARKFYVCEGCSA